eukprot:gene7625-8919_t
MEIIIKDLMNTTLFAAQKHRDQRRKDAHGTPYINHPIGVACNIVNIGGVTDRHVLQAALLHDTIEDTDCTENELRVNFGDEVTDIVLDVTDDKSLGKAERKRMQVEHASHIRHESKIVKLADKLYNLTDILTNAPPSWSLLTIQGYFVWGKKVISQIRGTNAGLEAALDKLFASSITINGVAHPVIPCKSDDEEEVFLASYYASMI